MFCDLREASFLLNYKSPATLYRLMNAGLLDDYIEYFRGQRLLRMNRKGKSPLLAEKVRSLVNFRGGHEMFMFDPMQPESRKRIEQYSAMIKEEKLILSQV